MLIGRILEQRRRDTVRVTEVTGHAEEDMVRVGQVRELDRLGNNAADEAADFGRRCVDHAVIDARRNLSGVCKRWYPIVWELHRFFIAISRVVVPHDDFVGTARILSNGLLVLFPRGVGWFMQCVIMICCLAQLLFGPLIASAFFLLLLLLRMLMLDLAVGGVSYVGILLLPELWFGETCSGESFSTVS